MKTIKAKYLISIVSCTITAVSLTARWFTSSLTPTGEAVVKKETTNVQQHIAEKLAEYDRLQNSIENIKQLDSTDFLETWFSTKEAAQRADLLGNDIDTVISDIKKIQASRRENEENYNLVMQQVQQVIIDIKNTKQTITNSVTKINLYTQRMIETMNKLQETKTYLDNSRTTISKLLPALFMIQNAYTNQAWSIDDLKLLVDTDSMGETLSFDDMLQGLSAKLDTVLWEMTEAQTRYTQAFAQMYELRKQLKASTLTYHEKIQVLEEQRWYLLDFLSLYKSNKISLDKAIDNLFETRTQLKKRIGIMVDKISNMRWTEEFISLPWYQQFATLKDDREQRPNLFSRPVLPVNTISTFFWDPISLGEQKEDFNGIQIDAEQWQELYAPANGLVYFVQNQDGVWMNWLVLIHNNWYISVFSNVQEVLVQPDSVVRRWQLIGLVWWQPGTRGAGWFSNGSKVTMQLFKNDKAIDPLELMDLSVINTPAMLPEKYQTKYDTDSRMRHINIDMSVVKFMQGNTVRERRLRFLDTVAAGPYADIMLWETAAEWTNVDVDLWICIWYAETSMGRHFASANNIGNVGNNDRGDRVDKASPLDGARAIYNTLNNQYLWKYQTIYELSGYWNKDWAIYASSEYNWQKNVSRCLSTIKWYIVPEDYPFRTYLAIPGDSN
jgi:murein DD-endopeptidase MepM/ murein hydrolase activator NlpD